CAFESSALPAAHADTRQAIQEKKPAFSGIADLPRTPVFLEFVRQDPCSVEEAYGLGGSLFLNGANKSIGTGRNVVVLCSLEISRMVWRKRSCSAIGSLLIIAAACTIFSAA